jgi:hypothetical protein
MRHRIRHLESYTPRLLTEGLEVQVLSVASARLTPDRSGSGKARERIEDNRKSLMILPERTSRLDPPGRATQVKRTL